jgi:hypothetical protein
MNVDIGMSLMLVYPNKYFVNVLSLQSSIRPSLRIVINPAKVGIDVILNNTSWPLFSPQTITGKEAPS